jgi:hypothetical protein
MELFLNLLWLLVALGILGVWRGSWIRQRQNTQRNSLAEWAALGCVLITLFFAISLTDDLHYDVALFDECTTGRRQSIVCAVAHGSSHGEGVVTGSGPAVLPRIAPHESLSLIAGVTRAPNVSVSFVQTNTPSARAPPAAFL